MTDHQQQQSIIVTGHQSQALPALVNCFCCPGLGQLIQGRLLAAIVWWVLNLLGALSLFVVIGFVLWPIIWIACVIDAARYNPTGVQISGKRQTSPAVTILAAVLALAVFVSVIFMIVTSLQTPNAQPSGTLSKSVGTTTNNASIDAEDSVPISPAVSPPPGDADVSPDQSAPRPSASKTEQDETTSGNAAPDPAIDNDESPAVTQSTKPNPQLILEEWRFAQESLFVKATGRVTNNTSSPLENVTAVAMFYDADGSFVKASEAIISFNPILPGQTSPFEVIDTDNPAITKASVSFKFLLRGTITSITREKLDKPTPEELAAKRQAEEEAERAQAVEDARRAAVVEAAKWRTWTTANGKHTVEAKFVTLAFGTLSLEKKDGTSVDVKLDILCEDDQQFVKQRKWKNAAKKD